jgi:predicted nucleic acid-binding protein
MKAVFADAFYFCALLNCADAAHGRAVAFARQNTQPLVTTMLVLAELANTFAETSLRRRTGEFIRALESSAQFRASPLTTELWDASLLLYQQREDKEWSLTDCSSFVLMRQLSLRVALTGDHHFIQAGFETVFA